MDHATPDEDGPRDEESDALYEAFRSAQDLPPVPKAFYTAACEYTPTNVQVHTDC